MVLGGALQCPLKQIPETAITSRKEGHSSELSRGGKTKDRQAVIKGLTITGCEGRKTAMPTCLYAKTVFTLKCVKTIP